MRLGPSILCVVALCYALPRAASAQWTCSLPATSEWLREGSPPSDDFAEIDRSRIHIVTHYLDTARTMLSARSIVPLDRAQLSRFLGGVPASPAKGLQPYLVRAVFPVSNPVLGVRVQGSALTVLAGGLGCASFVKHPIIVYLEREPVDVFVIASADM